MHVNQFWTFFISIDRQKADRHDKYLFIITIKRNEDSPAKKKVTNLMGIFNDKLETETDRVSKGRGTEI